MNSRVILRLTSALLFAALIAVGITWKVTRADDFNPQPDPPGKFGMVGITRGQTIRLNIVNLIPPPDPDIPPPCRVVLSFRDVNGRPFTNSDGQLIRRVVELQAGDSASLDLNADMFLPPTTNDVAPTRLQLRPFVRVLQQPPPDPELPPDPCFATMEVFDHATGRTSLFANGLATPPDPELAP